MHRLDRRLARVQPARLDEELHALDDDDAVVHDDADRQHEPEERERVDRVAEEGHQDERGAERDGDREAGDERRAPVLQEDVAHEDDESERDEERLDDLLDAHAHVLRRVVGHRPFEVVRERLRLSAHLVVDPVHRRDRIRARLLLEGDRDGVSAIELAREGVVLLAHLGARHVLEAHEAAVRVAADDDLVELLRRHEAALRLERVDLRAVFGDRRRAHGADRGLDVLLRDGVDHLLGVEALRREAVGVHPHAHRELRTVDGRLAHARHAQERRLDVRIDVVGDLQARHRALRRAEAEEAEHVRGLRADLAAELLHLLGQLRLGLRDAVLHLHHVHVAVALDLEGDLELVGAVVRTAPRHVEHIINAVHLVLDRHRDGVEHLARVGAGVGVGDRNRGRRELRILRHRQASDRHEAGEGQHDGDDHREARTLDEDARERLDLVN